jgi:hypothetical protein
MKEFFFGLMGSGFDFFISLLLGLTFFLYLLRRTTSRTELDIESIVVKRLQLK